MFEPFVFAMSIQQLYSPAWDCISQSTDLWMFKEDGLFLDTLEYSRTHLEL